MRGNQRWIELAVAVLARCLLFPIVEAHIKLGGQDPLRQALT
ncbi:hypothetical protein [Alkalilimnicola sp. S0819]|nr:hypothetical protein [Alkalilimnicola sp. S0819]